MLNALAPLAMAEGTFPAIAVAMKAPDRLEYLRRIFVVFQTGVVIAPDPPAVVSAQTPEKLTSSRSASVTTVQLLPLEQSDGPPRSIPPTWRPPPWQSPF